jgi:hypothetical protein
VRISWKSAIRGALLAAILLAILALAWHLAQMPKTE